MLRLFAIAATSCALATHVAADPAQVRKYDFIEGVIKTNEQNETKKFEIIIFF